MWVSESVSQWGKGRVLKITYSCLLYDKATTIISLINRELKIKLSFRKSVWNRWNIALLGYIQLLKKRWFIWLSTKTAEKWFIFHTNSRPFLLYTLFIYHPSYISKILNVLIILARNNSLHLRKIYGHLKNILLNIYPWKF